MKFIALVSSIDRETVTEPLVGGSVHSQPGELKIKCKIIPAEIPEGFLTPVPFERSRASDIAEQIREVSVGLTREEAVILGDLFSRIEARVSAQVNK